MITKSASKTNASVSGSGRYAVRNSTPDACFNRIARLVARHFDVALALISLTDNSFHWSVPRSSEDVEAVECELAFCAATKPDACLLVVADASRHPEFSATPVVTGETRLRFYAAMPLADREGGIIGSIHLLDPEPRADFSEDQRQDLADFSAVIIDELLLRQAATPAITKRGGSSEPDLRPVGEELVTLINNAPVAEAMFDKDMNYLAASHSWCSPYVSVAKTDISEIIAAEEKLRESEQRYRLIYNETPAMLHSINPAGHLISVSEYWLETLGYSREEVIGRKLTDFLTPESKRLSEEKILPEFLRTGSCRDVEYQFVGKNGGIIDILLSAIGIRDDAGAVERSLAVLIDVTKRKTLENQLLQSQKMEAVGQLTGGLAHDFNNLLAIVMGNLQLIDRMVAVDEKVMRKVNSAMKAAQRGADLTQRLLAFSRRQTLETTVIDPNQLVEGMDDLLRRTLGASIDLKTSLADDIWPIRTDVNQLETAILNLAVNARDAMNDGGLLTIETAIASFDADTAAGRQEVSPGDYVVISVTDNGSGMIPEVVKNVFQPFFTTKEVGRGTGLGLSMVYGFAKQIGGHVDIYSEPDFGTTVRIYLPKGDPIDLIRPVQVDQSEDATGGSEMILLVEDDIGVRLVAEELLQELGYSVVTADSGQAALEILRSRKDIRLLFTDIVMPGGLNGADLASQAVRDNPDLKIVYASGFSEASILRQSMIQTKGELLSKPYNRSDLARAVRRALDAPRENSATRRIA